MLPSKPVPLSTVKISQLHNEAESLARLRAGDAGALTDIYHAYWEKLFLAAYNMLKDREAAEDIVQDIFVSLWAKRESLEIHTALNAYLYSATRYQVFKVIREGKKHVFVFENIEERIWGEGGAENRLYQKDLQEKVKEVVNGLPEKCREIYLLSREAQLSHKEIAERLGLSTKTVENQLTIALRRIRGSLGELLPLIVLFITPK